MIIDVTMKTPDAMRDAIEEAVRDSGCLDDDPKFKGMVEEEIYKMCHWFRWSEYLDIKFDTEKMTATVKLQSSIKVGS